LFTILYNWTCFRVLVLPGRRFIKEEAHIRMKTMKPHCKTLPHFQVLACTFLATVVVLALSTAQMTASGQKLVPASTLKKLDTQLVLALKKSRGEPPFDKPTSLEPDIPVKHNGRVLVDMEATVSQGLLNYIVLVGGWVNNSSATTTTLRAMVPFSQLEALAGRPDVKFIFPAKLIINSKIKAAR
jgi:hypothetical protein